MSTRACEKLFPRRGGIDFAKRTWYDEKALKIRGAHGGKRGRDTEAIERIQEMETILQEAKPVLARLDDALEDYSALRERLRTLARYYGSADWRADFAMDEAGLLPKDLRRGVLSEDEVYDLLAEEEEIRGRMRTLLNTETEESP